MPENITTDILISASGICLLVGFFAGVLCKGFFNGLKTAFTFWPVLAGISFLIIYPIETLSIIGFILFCMVVTITGLFIGDKTRFTDDESITVLWSLIGLVFITYLFLSSDSTRFMYAIPCLTILYTVSGYKAYKLFKELEGRVVPPKLK